MTQEEKEKYNAICEYHIDGVYLKGTASNIKYVDFQKLEGEERWDATIQFIKDCVDADLKLIKEKLMSNEVR